VNLCHGYFVTTHNRFSVVSVWRFLWLNDPRPPPMFKFRCHTQSHHIRYNSSGRVISLTNRSLPDNTQHSQKTDIPLRGVIRTRSPSRRAAADPRLRLRGHWDRLCGMLTPQNPELHKYASKSFRPTLIPHRPESSCVYTVT
jgi:hypothetical protein